MNNPTITDADREAAADRFATREEVEEGKRVIEELRFGRFNAFARRTRKLEKRNG